jgi:hypothetical protein
VADGLWLRDLWTSEVAVDVPGYPSRFVLVRFCLQSGDHVREGGGGDAPAASDADRRDSAGAHELVELRAADAQHVGGLIGREQQLFHVVLHTRGRAAMVAGVVPST